MTTKKKYIATQGVGTFRAGQEVSGFSAERIKIFLSEGVIADMSEIEAELTDEEIEAAEEAKLAEEAKAKAAEEAKAKAAEEAKTTAKTTKA